MKMITQFNVMPRTSLGGMQFNVMLWTSLGVDVVYRHAPVEQCIESDPSLTYLFVRVFFKLQ